MVVPNFFICGAPKAGTTALYHYLRDHPDIFLPDKKETQFFSARTHYQKGVDWFIETYYSAWDGESAVGEASPQTMASREAPYRIARHSPDAKLIFLLRDPGERLFSHYHYEVQNGRINPLDSFSSRIRTPSLWRHDMISNGLYYEHLRRYEDCFDPSQILVLLNRDFKQKTEETVRSVFRFIDVDPEADVRVEDKHNETTYPSPRPLFSLVWGSLHTMRATLGSRVFEASAPWVDPIRRAFYENGSNTPPEMDTDDRTYLASVYSAWNERLASHIDRSLEHWPTATN
jgi:hypothetical protein